MNAFNRYLCSYQGHRRIHLHGNGFVVDDVMLTEDVNMFNSIMFNLFQLADLPSLIKFSLDENHHSKTFLIAVRTKFKLKYTNLAVKSNSVILCFIFHQLFQSMAMKLSTYFCNVLYNSYLISNVL